MPLNLYDFCEESITGISFIYVDSDEVDNIKDNQEKRFSTGNTVAGTRDNHKFVPVFCVFWCEDRGLGQILGPAWSLFRVC